MEKPTPFEDFISHFDAELEDVDVLPCGTILIWTDTHVTIIKP